jgi:hypothetical protein
MMKNIKQFTRRNLSRIYLLVKVILITSYFANSVFGQSEYKSLKADFINLPLEKRLSMPLMWLHGEDDSTIIEHVDRVFEAGNGGLVIESRPHPYWLEPEWFADCKLIGDYAKTKGIKTWIFDEKWWPSFEVDGRVPENLRPKKLECSAVEKTGPVIYNDSEHKGSKYVKTIAGKILNDKIDASSLLDLSSSISDGTLSWNVPQGRWKIMKFTWTYQDSTKMVDLATQESANWFINNVIKPHYDAMGEENIAGFFFDEPQWLGRWGIGMEEDTPYWKEMMVGQFFTLAGENQTKATYTYWETLIERIGRVGFGTYQKYVNSRGGKLTGHFIEEDAWHNNKAGLTLRYSQGGALNILELEKYADMPAMDLIGFYNMMDNRGVKKNWSTYQLPKLISSVAITNNVPDHLAMCEIFGAAGWKLTYEDMKWWGDWCQVKGVNVMDPHSFNPKGSKSEPDTDCPPYFYYTGDEDNWPKYKAWCDRQNRIAYMLTGNDADNYSVAPVTMLWTGYSKYAEEPVNGDYKNEYPYNMQSALDRVHYDHNLLTYSIFDSNATLNPSSKQIELYNSKYKILIMPPVEIIPYEVLNKVKEFYDMGGIVIGWQRVPTKSARFDKNDSEIQRLSNSLWTSINPKASFQPLNTNKNGGKTYFIASTDENSITGDLRKILANSAIKSDFEVVRGEFEDWTHYNHRVRMGMDVFMVWNGNFETKEFTARITATGVPEIWNPTTKEITPASYKRVSTNKVDIKFSLKPEESVLVVFKIAEDEISE